MATRQVQDVVREFRRDQIIAAAREAFAKKESLDVPLEEIASLAGVSRSTIYNHFNDRGEILAACAAWAIDRFFAAIDEAVASDDHPEQILASFFEAAFVRVDENPVFYRLTGALRGTSAVADALVEAQATAQAASRSRIARLVRQLDAASDRPIDLDRAEATIGLVLVGALEQRVAQAAPPPAAKVARELADVLLNGLAGPSRGKGQ